MPIHPVLIAGRWKTATSSETFRAQNPATGEWLADEFPVSDWPDWDAALTAAAQVAPASPPQLAEFLNRYAQRIEAAATEIVEIAHQETALPKSPRLATIELPRTTGQLRQAATAALEGSWALPTIDTKLNIRSRHAALGPIAIFGPNNFPLAFNAISGGDFAAAIAAGNPVIAKAHPCHPGTTRLLAGACLSALNDAGLPAATVQMIYHTSPQCGVKLVADPRLGGAAFTGSRSAGLKLKAAADAAGKPIYLEMSSLNPVVILPGALRERGEKIADEFADSCLAASGQFCTNPGLVLLLAGAASERLIDTVKNRFESRAPAPLLSSGVATSLASSVKVLTEAGAKLVTGGHAVAGAANRFANTLLRVEAKQFLANPEVLQTEAFGNASLFVVAGNIDEAIKIIAHLDGNLTGCIYSDAAGDDDNLYSQVAAALRRRVGRLLNDKMPTGVAVSPAMNHGGPYPATGHPGFTAVGIPASLRRFSMLECYDNVRASRLPAILRNQNSEAKPWRLIDGRWTQGDVDAEK
jgi:NADP-dependent aldehyde dehydrogenase